MIENKSIYLDYGNRPIENEDDQSYWIVVSGALTDLQIYLDADKNNPIQNKNDLKDGDAVYAPFVIKQKREPLPVKDYTDIAFGTEYKETNIIYDKFNDDFYYIYTAGDKDYRIHLGEYENKYATRTIHMVKK